VKLCVYTQTDVLLEEDVSHVSAEAPTGSLGIRPGHAGLVTPLVQSILTVRRPDGTVHYVAVNGGVLVVNGDSVQVVSREAAVSDDLQRLERVVLQSFMEQTEQDRKTHTAFEKMRLDFMRRVLEFERTV